VEENLRLGALAGSRREHTDMFHLFPLLRERRREPAFNLSGGERQMLSIGRALASAPSVLLLDEPSLGLAPKVVRTIMGVLRGLADDMGLAVLLVEQNARSALSVADDAIVLALGRVAVREHADILARDEALRHAYLGF
jgi:branched-chain amino acid transport system ATP-binding protein